MNELLVEALLELAGKKEMMQTNFFKIYDLKEEKVTPAGVFYESKRLTDDQRKKISDKVDKLEKEARNK